MTEKEIIEKLPELLLLPKETEWLEFKQNNAKPSEIGEDIGVTWDEGSRGTLSKRLNVS